MGGCGGKKVFRRKKNLLGYSLRAVGIFELGKGQN